MKIANKPVWHWLIPRSWRVCIYFAENEQVFAGELGQKVRPVWYYLFAGKLTYYRDKLLGR